jgi:hypothetical protein
VNVQECGCGALWTIIDSSHNDTFQTIGVCGHNADIRSSVVVVNTAGAKAVLEAAKATHAGNRALVQFAQGALDIINSRPTRR